MPEQASLRQRLDSIGTVSCESLLELLQIPNQKRQIYIWTSFPSHPRAMAFARAAAFRSCFRAARPVASRPQLLQRVARRSYASGGHGSAQSGGDTMW